jgi:hypothetical protein
MLDGIFVKMLRLSHGHDKPMKLSVPFHEVFHYVENPRPVSLAVMSGYDEVKLIRK